VQSSESAVIELAISRYFPEAYDLPCASVCGGFIRSTLEGTPPNDLDVFFDSPDSLYGAVAKICGVGRYICTETRYAFTFVNGSKKIQFIKNIYGQYNELPLQFDFTVCMASIPLIPGSNVFMSGLCRDDLTARRIRIYGITDALGTLRRVARYMEYGYSIEPCDILTIHDALSLQRPKGDDYPEETLLPTTSTALCPDEYDPFAM